MMEHPYPRYNSCIGGGLQTDASMAFTVNNAINPHMGVDLNDYGQGVGVTGPSPGPSCIADSHLPPEPPQQNVPVRRRRTANPQSEENFQRALEAVRFGGIGFCKAARMFGVNNRTLWLEYKKKGYPNNRPSIKSRIKREHASPPPESKEELPPIERQMAPPCPPIPSHPVPVVSFIDSRPVDFPPLQSTILHGSPLNLHGINFNTMQ